MIGSNALPREGSQALGKIGEVLRNPLWYGLIDHMDEVHGVEPGIAYSVCSGALSWNVKYRKGGRNGNNSRFY